MRKYLCCAAASFILVSCAGTPKPDSLGIAFAETPEMREMVETLEAEDPRMAETVCRTEPVTGSLTRVNRICLSRAEWRVIETANAENVRTLQGRAGGGLVCEMDPSGGCS